jgi:hypothetical protein
MTKDDPAAELVTLLDSGPQVVGRPFAERTVPRVGLSLGEMSAPPARMPALRVIAARS